MNWWIYFFRRRLVTVPVYGLSLGTVDSDGSDATVTSFGDQAMKSGFLLESKSGGKG
jgi:hypothetical protein